MSTLKDTIKARRKLIRDQAACDTCCGSRAACKAEMRRDPEAPFGCCDRCCHRASASELVKLLKEIESGTVRTVAELTQPARDRQAVRHADRAERLAKGMPGHLSMATMFDQGVWWKSRDDGWVRVADMSDTHRRNLLGFLDREAGRLAWQIGFAELVLYEGAPDEVVDAWIDDEERRMSDPLRWMRSTPLYQAVADHAPFRCTCSYDEHADDASGLIVRQRTLRAENCPFHGKGTGR